MKRIRKSIGTDAEHFIAIKEQLALSNQSERRTQGGFLLGTDLDTYRFFIRQGICYTAEVSARIVGFGIVLPNALVRQSEIWSKRKEVDWKIDLKLLENSNVAYLEQLAFLPGHQKWVLVLSHNLVHTAFKNEATYILTTTVRKPILNPAALPLIHAAGGIKVGNIDEVYPQVGNINSDIYCIEKSVYYQKIGHRISHQLLKTHQLVP